MPLYECRCEPCDLTFEVLAPLSSSGMKTRPCPECGRPSRRVISAAALAVGRGGSGTREASDPARSGLTNLSVPPPARLCWMDNRSAARFAAYKHGRGAEYDDTAAAREELQKKRGAPPENSVPRPHDHSPLADPAVFARRREAAARKAKIAESKNITGHLRSPA